MTFRTEIDSLVAQAHECLLRYIEDGSVSFECMCNMYSEMCDAKDAVFMVAYAKHNLETQRYINDAWEVPSNLFRCALDVHSVRLANERGNAKREAKKAERIAREAKVATPVVTTKPSFLHRVKNCVSFLSK